MAAPVPGFEAIRVSAHQWVRHGVQDQCQREHGAGIACRQTEDLRIVKQEQRAERPVFVLAGQGSDTLTEFHEDRDASLALFCAAKQDLRLCRGIAQAVFPGAGLTGYLYDMYVHAIGWAAFVQCRIVGRSFVEGI